MSGFTRAMYEQTVGRRRGFPPWPFEVDEVPCLDAYGVFVQEYKKRDDDARFYEPELVDQPVNCRAAFLFYLASRLTFVDCLALHRGMIRALENRLADLNNWLEEQPLTRVGESARSSMRKLLEELIREGLEHLAMDLVSDDNRRFFEDEALWVAAESMGCLISSLYSADRTSNIISAIIEDQELCLFETLIAPIMAKCEQCPTPRQFEDAPVE